MTCSWDLEPVGEACSKPFLINPGSVSQKTRRVEAGSSWSSCSMKPQVLILVFMARVSGYQWVEKSPKKVFHAGWRGDCYWTNRWWGVGAAGQVLQRDRYRDHGDEPMGSHFSRWILARGAREKCTRKVHWGNGGRSDISGVLVKFEVHTTFVLKWFSVYQYSCWGQ